MKSLAILILLFVQNAWCGAELHIGPASPEQFTFAEKDPTRIFLNSNGKSEEIDLRYSISNLEKLTIKTATSSVEMLFVVLSVGNRIQAVQMYIPQNLNSSIVGRRTNPLCNLRNHGDFSWNSSEELRNKIRLTERNGNVSLEVMIQPSANGPRVYTQCVTVQGAA